MDYYTQTLYIPQVDENDTIIGKVERWKAHQEGILHRGFTVGFRYKGELLLQHRKHPVFGGYVDLSFSSHPVYHGDILQTMEEALYASAQREWGLTKEDIISPLKLEGKAQYKSQDKEYIEHEVCSFYTANIGRIPRTNYDYAYGQSLVPWDELQGRKNHIYDSLAPWVVAYIEGTEKEEDIS